MHACMHVCIYICNINISYIYIASRRLRQSSFRQPVAPHLALLRRWLLDLASATLAVPK